MKPREQTGLDQALARAGDGAFAIAPGGRIVSWNPAAERILGYTSREALGRPCCDLFVGRDDRGNRLCYRGCHVMALVRMGDPVQSFDMQTRTKAGKPIWINVSVLVVPDARGGSVTVHLFRDVTATRELLALARERLSPPSAAAEADGQLTRRELEVLRMLASGATTRSAADQLHVSPATIRNHVQNILGKLGVHSRLQAVAHALGHRML